MTLRFFRFLLTVSAVLTAVCLAGPTAQAAPKLSSATIKAWCKVGHGGDTNVKLTPMTPSNYYQLAADAEAMMTDVPDAYAKNPKEFWELNAGMGGAGSPQEDVLTSWLANMASSHSKLLGNVDTLRVVVAKLRVEVRKHPDRFSVMGVADMKGYLKDFGRFEAAVKEFAPQLKGACSK